jgi:hypothetical protein
MRGEIGTNAKWYIRTLSRNKSSIRMYLWYQSLFYRLKKKKSLRRQEQPLSGFIYGILSSEHPQIFLRPTPSLPSLRGIFHELAIKGPEDQSANAGPQISAQRSQNQIRETFLT